MRVCMMTATAPVADDDVMKPKAARRGCRAPVVTGLLAGVLVFRAALLAVETGASLCSSSTGTRLTVTYHCSCYSTLLHFRARR
jgi:hypothetical protein